MTSLPPAAPPATPATAPAKSDDVSDRDRQRLQKTLQRKIGQAVVDFSMITPGDRVMVCVSGGKDSYTLLDMLLHLQKVAPVEFSLIAVNLDQKQPGFPEHILPNYLRSLGVEYRVVEEDTYSIVKEKIPEGATTCSLCSRLRRGILYRTADELGATRIALGHHADDMLETLLLNLFHGGSIKSMPAKLHTDDGRHIVIRPLAYCREATIAAYAGVRRYPIIPCDLCGSQPNLQRQSMKRLIADWEAEDPSRIASMLTALRQVSPSHLLDRKLYDFDNNRRIGPSGGDKPARADSPLNGATRGSTRCDGSTGTASDGFTTEFPLHRRQ